LPSIEVAIDVLLVITIVSLLAIQRRHRIKGDAEPIAVSVATGAILGLVTVFAAALVASWIIAAL
jgi:hypothetical protein